MADLDFLKASIALAKDNVARGGQPFGAVLVKDGEVLAEGVNQTYIDHDPTAHAEIQALRNAARIHQRSLFAGSTMYASGKPCAMCMAAMIQAGVSRLVYCAGDDVGEGYGWSTDYLYRRMQQPFGEQGVVTVHLPLAEKTAVFELWRERHGQGGNEHIRRD
ncbi:nucleoside deaminase [Oceanimonas pelagia]|uniref:Nucleoside deaminase n=1 Tax=Oceanimonas pelagia TaxID=3028314 RepID=A0AA50KNJ7_9GAMM|nr:nucleoside deaminase [Oceanimonas pelagia]WMC10353.1 nucleoside deaminase [Oceanimonas pelagia]